MYQLLQAEGGAQRRSFGEQSGECEAYFDLFLYDTLTPTYYISPAYAGFHISLMVFK